MHNMIQETAVCNIQKNKEKLLLMYFIFVYIFVKPVFN